MSKLRIMSHNARSFKENSRYNRLKAFVRLIPGTSLNSLDLCCFQETRSLQNPEHFFSPELQLACYSIAVNNDCASLATFHSNTLEHTRSVIPVAGRLAISRFRLKASGKIILVANIYGFTGNKSQKLLLDKIENQLTLESRVNTNFQFFLIGDLNIDMGTSSINTLELENFMLKWGLTDHSSHSGATWWGQGLRSNLCSKIDYIMSNGGLEGDLTIVPSPLSDHCVLIIAKKEKQQESTNLPFVFGKEKKVPFKKRPKA